MCVAARAPAHSPSRVRSTSFAGTLVCRSSIFVPSLLCARGTSARKHSQTHSCTLAFVSLIITCELTPVARASQRLRAHTHRKHTRIPGLQSFSRHASRISVCGFRSRKQPAYPVSHTAHTDTLYPWTIKQFCIPVMVPSYSANVPPSFASMAACAIALQERQTHKNTHTRARGYLGLTEVHGLLHVGEQVPNVLYSGLEHDVESDGTGRHRGSCRRCVAVRADHSHMNTQNDTQTRNMYQ